MNENLSEDLVISSKPKIRKIGLRNIISILLIGTAGQIAWAVENSWFNTFVYDEITTDPTPVAWMVSVSAATATITTIILGTFSDRTYGKMGKRKPYIVFGYIIWGIITAIYPMVNWIQLIGVAIVMVVIIDAIMTFFGSTANDAAYNAWITDISHSSNRNRIQSINDLNAYLANIIAIVGAGVIIDNFGYFVFFYILGGIVTLTGIVSLFLVKSEPVPKEELKDKKPFLREFVDLVNPRLFQDNRTLFLLFTSMAITGIAMQVYFPYLFIFIEHYMGFSKTQMSLYLGIFFGLVMISLILIGLISHRFNRKTLLIFGTIVGGVFTALMGVMGLILGKDSPNAIWLFILYFVGAIPGLSASIALGGWMFDKYPKGDIGKFQGVRMIFMVAIPMMIGPWIGSTLIDKYGIIMPNGDIIPTPEIFLVGGLISLLCLIPIFFINKSEGIIKFVQ